MNINNEKKEIEREENLMKLDIKKTNLLKFKFIDEIKNGTNTFEIKEESNIIKRFIKKIFGK
tara:strand:- start:789 stop:974 length:186 start_codon:yes stop_codon:yes gene_type:complete